jgi:hypothetical protein
MSRGHNFVVIIVVVIVVAIAIVVVMRRQDGRRGARHILENMGLEDGQSMQRLVNLLESVALSNESLGLEVEISTLHNMIWIRYQPLTC